MRGRRWLIASQSLLAAVLVSVASTAGSLFLALVDTDLGIDYRGVLTTTYSLPRPNPPAEHATAAFAALKETLQQTPGVRRVAFVDVLPYLIMPSMETFTGDGMPASFTASVRRVDAEYFDVLSLKLVTGRLLDSTDGTGPPRVAVVSQGLAKAWWADRSPLGRHITLERKLPLEIVGVVGDARDVQLEQPPVPTVYIPNTDRSYRRYAASRGILIQVEPSQEAAVVRSVDELLTKQSGVATVFPVRPLESRIGRSLWAPRLYAWLTGVFAWFAVLVAGAGTFAIASYVAAQRRYERAVRLVCGASRSHIVSQALAYAGGPLLIGLALGTMLGAAVGHSFASAVYRDMGVPVSALAIAVLAVAAVTLVAVTVPAYRAASDDLSQLLRAT